MKIFKRGATFIPGATSIPKSRVGRSQKIIFAKQISRECTLDSGIDVAPGINVAPPLKNFHITILTLFYINLGIAVIFDFIFSSIFFKN